MRSIGIDLGTSNTIVYSKEKGIILNENNVLEEDYYKNLIKVLKELKINVFKPTSLTLSLPITKKPILKELSNKLKKHGVLKINIYNDTTLELISNEVDINKSSASMVINIGYKETNISILALGQTIFNKTISIGGETFNKSIFEYLKSNKKIELSQEEIEKMKCELSTGNNDKFQVSGISTSTHKDTKLQVTKKLLKLSISKDIEDLSKEINKVINKLKPEIISNIKEKGIILTGGASLTLDLYNVLKKEIEIPIFLSENPTIDTIKGIEIVMKNK